MGKNKFQTKSQLLYFLIKQHSQYRCPINNCTHINVLYLATKLKVDHDDGDLSTGDDEDDEHDKEEPKQIVELVLPDCLQRTSQLTRGYYRCFSQRIR